MWSRTTQHRWLLALIGLLALPGSTCLAGSPSGREQLLRLLPADTGICLVVSDLRDHWKKTAAASWFKAFKDSSLGNALTRSPEFQHLLRFESDLKKHLGVDIAQLRDDIFGDAVVLVYIPAPAQRPQDEEGLLLLWARDPTMLSQLVERLNNAQKSSGELRELAPVLFQGKTYFRRVEPHKTHYYLVDGNLLAFSSREKRVRDVIDGRGAQGHRNPELAKSLRRADADRALSALWLNPRAFDRDLLAKAQGEDPQSQVVKGFLKYWQAIDAIVMAGSLGAEPEFRLSVQARAADVPAALQALFSKDYQASELWERFPDKAMLRIAGKIDVLALMEVARELTPASAREAVGGVLRKSLAAALGLDFVKDVLPRLGPDWGLCIAAADDPNSFPHVIVALAVQPGPQPVSAGAALFKAAQFFTQWAAFQHNLVHADAFHVKTVQQDKNDVLYVDSKLFPAGLQPALTLKDGYLLMASSPQALTRFQKGRPAPVAKEDLPLLHLSLSELSRWLDGRKDKVSAFLQSKNQFPAAKASAWLDGLLAGLSLFDELSLSQRSDAGQVAWMLRLRAAKKR